MQHQIRRFLARHEPPCVSLAMGVKCAAGGVVGIAAVGGAAAVTGLPLLIAPFGASAVLLFGHPASALAQPANVVGGYALSALVGLAVALALPHAWWAAALGVGLAILAMLAARLSHPPAGAVPILMAVAAGAPLLLAGIVLAGSVGLVVLATLYHRLPPAHDYPKTLT